MVSLYSQIHPDQRRTYTKDQLVRQKVVIKEMQTKKAEEEKRQAKREVEEKKILNAEEKKHD